MKSDPRKILFVTSEVAPYSKTGGLADISAALPKALANLGCDVRVISPLYGFIDPRSFDTKTSLEHIRAELILNGRKMNASVVTDADSSGVKYHFLRCDALYDRPGIYVDPFTNQDYLDNDYRYIALCRGALELCRMLQWSPDIFQSNDWQAALTTFYLAQCRKAGEFEASRSALTIHNMAYHGWFRPETLPRIGDAQSLFFPTGPFEFYGLVNFLKVGIEFADGLSTVSPTYATEVQSSYDFGYGLESLLRNSPRPLRGILNGIDTEIWNPETDARIPAKFGATSMTGKVECKKRLCDKAGFRFDESTPMFAMISRIVNQKGFEILAPILHDILNLPAQFVVLGSGDPYYEHMFHEMARHYGDWFAVKVAYDEDLAHLIEAGADIFMMPSKFEPCGLNQMMSMRYGTIPVVRATGGLADTVIDADADPEHGTGFRFDDYQSGELMHTVARAVRAFRDPVRWQSIQRNAMRKDFSWDQSAKQYIQLYSECLELPARV